MEIEYIIIQAGGRGSRLEHLTQNKPKAIVPVDNLPMIFHLFKKFPDNKFIIIADYKKDVLIEYLRVFANVKYQIVESEGTGTCSGIKSAMEFIDNQKAFMLIWSDLILPDNYELPSEDNCYIGISKTFKCRWKYENNEFCESESIDYGVAGMFIFNNKTYLDDIDNSGEFVRYLSNKNINFKETSLANTKEFGILDEYNKVFVPNCRPFNKISIQGDKLIKEGIDKLGKTLSVRETSWYKFVSEQGYDKIPKIYDTNPLIMEKINGKNIYEYEFNFTERKNVIKSLVQTLIELHNLDETCCDKFSVYDAYFGKTYKRLETVRNLIPFSNQKTIVINNRECKNIYFYYREVEDRIRKLDCKEFKVIHGDCTFSNMMLKNDLDPILIDPRGYFGYTEIYGDPLYDWAKIYYSIKGNYDRFNNKEFNHIISENEVKLEIESNGWEDVEDYFLNMIGVNIDDIKLIHAIIWLSLTTYTWHDYDSICGAFYNGLYYLEEIL